MHNQTPNKTRSVAIARTAQHGDTGQMALSSLLWIGAVLFGFGIASQSYVG